MLPQIEMVKRDGVTDESSRSVFFLIKPPNDRPTGRISVASRFAKTETADQQGSSGTFLSSTASKNFHRNRKFSLISVASAELPSVLKSTRAHVLFFFLFFK